MIFRQHQCRTRAAFTASALALISAGATLFGPAPASAQQAGRADAPAAARPQAATFKHAGVARDAERYAGWLATNIRTPNAQPAHLKAIAAQALAANPRVASSNYAQALAIDKDDAEAWLGLARALLSTQPATNNSSERYQLPLNASGAAYLAYERAQSARDKAQALVVLSEALKRRSYWRPAIDALSTSLALAENADVRRTYDALKAEHGFRITDHRLDSDVAAPRLCVQFSEPLARGNVDFAKFVSVDGKDPGSVTTEARQLCVAGLKHGQRYEVKVRAGLPSDVGETLAKTAEIAAYVRDRAPSIRFSGRNYVLPSRGQNGIPLVSINTERADVEIYRIGDRSLAATVQSGEFSRQLMNWDVTRLRENTGTRVWQGAVETPIKLNQEVTTAVPLNEALPKIEPGAYAMIARPAKADRTANDDAWATQWFVVSDLGLTALTGEDGVTAIVRSLATADAAKAATVRLIARNNEVLATAKTDNQGLARFTPNIARGEGGLQPAILVAESANGDYAFLDLSQNAFDLSDRGVKGRPAPGPIDGYLFAERGIYRPGEDVHLTGLVRDASGRAASLPVTLIVTRPDGVEHRRIALSDQGLGGRLTTLGLGGNAMTGTWRTRLHVDPKAPAIAQTSFLVEDFVPERLALELTPVTKTLTPTKPGEVKIAGRYLYGPPAADLAIEGEIVVKPAAREIDGFAGYRFGQADERIAPVRRALDALPTTGKDGTATIAVTLPALPKTAKPMTADLIVRLREPGGRTIERRVSVPVELGLPRIGLKPAFGDQGPGEGQTTEIDAVLLGADGKPESAALEWTLYRLDTSWQWFKRDGQWAYEAVSLTRKVASGKAETQAAAARIATQVTYGRYRLEVAQTDKPDVAASLVFNSGWNVAGEDVDSPEMLEVALDKPIYKAGDSAKVRIATRHAGKAVVTVLAGGVRHVAEADIASGGGEVAIPVAADWGPGAYVAAILYRAMDERAKRMPARAIGVAWLGLDQTGRTLNVTLDAPEKVKSAGRLIVPIRIAGLAAGEDARVTLAAVDVGILNLTRYSAPKPEAWFNAQRQLGMEIRDFYGRLIDGMRAERGKLRFGGDGGAGMAAEGSPPVERLVALHSGIVKVDPNGTASVTFDLPDFNGTVRLMAVAWSATRTGSTNADVIVRDPIALTASTPRFMTLGDEIRIALDLHNVEGVDGTYEMIVTGGPVDQIDAPAPATPIATRKVALKSGERRQETLTVKPGAIGPASYAVRVTGPGGIDVRRDLAFDVKVPAGDIRRTTVSRIAPGGTLTLSSDIAAELIASRTRINLSVGPYASLDVPGLLTALDRYPYGCAEQTVSRALPLLYANTVATTIGMATDAAIKERVQKAVDRVFDMQDSAGGFGVWGPFNTDMWLTAYVTDFLSRAKEQGFVVRPRAFTQALDKLQAYVSYAQDFAKGGEARAYAMYVLARSGRAPIGELRYYADTRLDRFSTPLAQAQIGAALAMMGDRPRAEAVFAKALAHVESVSEDAARMDYGSKLRDGAALVTLASEARVARAASIKLVDVIAKAYRARTHTSTQEQAWMLLAANALADEAKATRLTIGGARHEGQLVRAVSAEALKSGAITIRNDGTEPVDAVISVHGAALTPEPAATRGFAITRSAYTLDGKPVDLASLVGGNGKLQQNDRLVMVLKVEAKETGGRIMLVDRLPAGLEIENPRLVDGGDIKSLPWLKTTVKPEHSEFRDDRFVAAFNFFGRNAEDDNNVNRDAASQATIAYVVRAVTPGTFIHPATTVEDMYRPERHARSAAGKLTIEAAGK